jgi:prolyl-tRNA editing enzyme YbaK/EbsC (Cys-tRNA(Pro) deacylase)
MDDDALREFFETEKLWHKFIDFEDPVITVEQAKRRVPIEKIVKSIVLVGYDGFPLLAVVPAKNRIRFAKIKKLLNLRDIRLATPEETLRYSGYEVGGVSPFNHIERVLIDPLVLDNETSIVGGGNVKRLVEVKTQDIVRLMHPKIANIVE